MLTLQDIGDLPGRPMGAENTPQDRLYPVIGIPLLVQENLIGSLHLRADNLSGGFTQEHVQIAREIADQLAIALQQTHLHEKIQRHAEELEQHVAERTAELLATKERVETILNNSSDAIVFLTFDGVMQQVNPAFNELFGYQIDEIYGHSLIKLASREDAELVLDVLKITVNTSQTSRLDFVGTRKDGSSFDADMALAPIRQEEKVQGLVCSVRDITERKQAETELRLALDQEKELNELKSRFSSMVSHEFRTPLTVIRSSTDLLQRYADRMDADKRQEHFGQIQSQIEQLVNMLNEVLALGRAENVDVAASAELLNLVAFCSGINIRNAIDNFGASDRIYNSGSTTSYSD